MNEGKMSNALLEDKILNSINHNRQDVIVGPGVGEDCGAIEFGDLACVVTTDPITGATTDLGKLVVHVCCNDIASAGVEPVGLTITILAPVGTTAETLQNIMVDANAEAESLNVAILGGHTEMTSAVNRIIVSGTAIGKGRKENLVTTSGGKPGDLIVMTKKAALEGTAIIASEKSNELKQAGFSDDDIHQAKDMTRFLSVVPEGIVGGGFGVSAMHDATEGGILGAVWELSQASKCGCIVNLNDIPVDSITKRISHVFNLDPLRLISSGSMIMTCSEDTYGPLSDALRHRSIEHVVIGRLTQSIECMMMREGVEEILLPPEADELYKIFTSDLQSAE